MINNLQNFSFQNNYGNDMINCRKFNPSFKAIERTLVILKPDAFEKKLTNTIQGMLKDNGFKVIKAKTGKIPQKTLETHYEEHKGKKFFSNLLQYMSGKTKAMVVEGDNAVSKVRELGTVIRTHFAYGNVEKNLIHTSDSPQSAVREIKNLFPKLDAKV